MLTYYNISWTDEQKIIAGSNYILSDIGYVFLTGLTVDQLYNMFQHISACFVVNGWSTIVHSLCSAKFASWGHFPPAWTLLIVAVFEVFAIGLLQKS